MSPAWNATLPSAARTTTEPWWTPSIIPPRITCATGTCAGSRTAGAPGAERPDGALTLITLAGFAAVGCRPGGGAGRFRRRRPPVRFAPRRAAPTRPRTTNQPPTSAAAISGSESTVVRPAPPSAHISTRTSARKASVTDSVHGEPGSR